MAIVMNMSSYEIERNPVESRHDRETSCFEWNSALASLNLQPVVSTGSKRKGMPAELATENVELFLQRI